MAKSSRSSTKKENNRRKASSIFGPSETARQERLSAKLLELAKQSKPTSSDVNMDVNDNATEREKEDEVAADETAMEVDLSAKSSKPRIDRKRIDKRKQKKSGIAFTKYSDRVASKKKKAGK